VYIQPDCLSVLHPCLCHWSSTTPEMQVLPARIVARCRAWLQQDGLVPCEDLSALARDSPLLHHLMMVEAKDGYVQSGDFWQLSDAVQELLGRMVLIVERTLTCTEQEAPPLDEAEKLEMDGGCEYSLPIGVERTEPTNFELFLWVRVTP
jgi:hypothetical protein